MTSALACEIPSEGGALGIYRDIERLVAEARRKQQDDREALLFGVLDVAWNHLTPGERDAVRVR